MPGFFRQAKTIIYCFCLIFYLATPQITHPADDAAFYYPAEWETQSNLWVGFRTTHEGANYEPVLHRMLAALAGHVHLNLLVESAEDLSPPKRYFSSIGLRDNDFTVLISKAPYFWLRDTGPIFLRNRAGKIRILGVPFTRYRDLADPQGQLAAANHQKYIDKIAQSLGIEIIPTDIVLEGGAFDVNGAGVVLLSSTIRDRNPQWSKKVLERKILQALGQHKAIWLKQGIAEDPYGFSKITGHIWGRGTGGHLDQFVRFVNGHTVLLAWVSEQERKNSVLAKINFQRMHENYVILKNSTDLKGKKMTIIKVPFPPPDTYDYIITRETEPLYRQRGIPLHAGDKIQVVAAASYLNFIIINDLILLPGYEGIAVNNRRTGKDVTMLKIMEKFFPHRKIVQVNPLRLNRHGGGMHCLVQQQPRAFP